jgi:hypothetical protein
VGVLHVFGDESDLHAEGLLGLACMHVTGWKVHRAQCMRGEGEGGFAGLELAVVT